MVEIKNTTKRNLYSGVPFTDIAEKILGKNFNLSLVFIGDQKAKNLNKKFLNKSYPTNVLAFPLSKTAGEIFINLNRAGRDHLKYQQKLKNHIAYLFIHACLHLKGYEHGSTMDSKEIKLMEHFKF